MDKHQKKVLAEAMKNLRWDFILDQLNVEYKFKGKAFASSKEKHTKESVKKELQGCLEYMIASCVEQVELDCWIIRWNTVCSAKQFNRLEIIFIPNRVVVREDELFIPDDEPAETIELSDEMLDNQEKSALTKILKQAEKDENYELCLSIHTRLKKLDKIIKRHDLPKKHKELKELRA
jgi:hypothetical protein